MPLLEETIIKSTCNLKFNCFSLLKYSLEQYKMSNDYITADCTVVVYALYINCYVSMEVNEKDSRPKVDKEVLLID